MLPPFRLGLGGPVGHGRQWMSWVSNRDVARAIAFLLETSAAEGPFNIVSPNPATNRDFSTALGRALHRPAILPVPPFVVKALYGTECAEATVLRSSRVLPTALVSAGFLFEDPILESALQWALKHP
jgi:NAD dependent epimerase/dehydratase family enzyme